MIQDTIFILGLGPHEWWEKDDTVNPSNVENLCYVSFKCPVIFFYKKGCSNTVSSWFLHQARLLAHHS